MFEVPRPESDRAAPRTRRCCASSIAEGSVVRAAGTRTPTGLSALRIFLPATAFAASPGASAGLWSGLSLHHGAVRAVRCCPSSLYTFPGACGCRGLGSGLPCARFPRIWAVLHPRFPGEHSIVSSPLRLPVSPRPHLAANLTTPPDGAKPKLTMRRRRLRRASGVLPPSANCPCAVEPLCSAAFSKEHRRMRFEGTRTYVATDDLKVAVNAADHAASGRCWSRASPAPARPMLAEEIADGARRAADRMARQVDHQGAAGPLRIRRGRAPARLPARRRARPRHPQLHQARASSGRRSPRDERPVLLIDEIDKADIEFPNDLLQELDRMEFYVYETGETVAGARAARSSSSPRTTRRSCPTPSCAAASSTTSASPTRETMQRDRRRALPGHQEARWSREALRHLLRDPRGAGPEEEALDLRAARLAQAAARRGHRRPRRCASATRQGASRRCTARCSRTSRTCTCSSGWRSWRGGKGGKAVGSRAEQVIR